MESTKINGETNLNTTEDSLQKSQKSQLSYPLFKLDYYAAQTEPSMKRVWTDKPDKKDTSNS